MSSPKVSPASSPKVSPRNFDKSKSQSPGSKNSQDQKTSLSGVFERGGTKSQLRGLNDENYVDVRGIVPQEFRLGSVDVLNDMGNATLTQKDLDRLSAKMKQFYSTNPFKPKLSETGQIIWQADCPVNGAQVAEVVEFTRMQKRLLHINTGTHGDKSGKTLLEHIKYAEAKFSKEDLKTAWDLDDVSVHIVSQNAPAFHPLKMDSIDAWCFSEATKHNLNEEDPKDTSNFFTKIYQSLCRESEGESPQKSKASTTYNVSTSGQNSPAIGSVSDGIGVNYGDAAQSTFHGPVTFGRK